MSHQSIQLLRDGEAKDHAQAKDQSQSGTEKWINSVKQSAYAAKDKNCETAHCAENSAQQGAQQRAGILLQTGENTSNMNMPQETTIGLKTPSVFDM